MCPHRRRIHRNRSTADHMRSYCIHTRTYILSPRFLGLHAQCCTCDFTLIYQYFATTNLLALTPCFYRPTATMLESGVGSEVCVSVVPQLCVPEWSMCVWLQSIGLERYRDTLAAAGYTSLDSLLALTHQ